jgi:thiosulfate dehydrogenase
MAPFDKSVQRKSRFPGLSRIKEAVIVFREQAFRCCLSFVLLTAITFSLPGSVDDVGASQNSRNASAAATKWTAPDPATIPEGPLGDSIRVGLHVFDETPKYAAQYVGNQMSCGHCHINSGTLAGAMPIVGVPGMFPVFREREKTVVTFEERIEQCFQRSEHGHRVPNDDPIMVGLVAYAQWLSKDQMTGRPFPGRGLVKLPELSGDRERGSGIYVQQCAVCHKLEGVGKPPAIPALWGPGAYDAGAGMNDIAKMAAFVQHNMPQNSPGSLTAQQAYDVSAFIQSKPHEPFIMKDHQ